MSVAFFLQVAFKSSVLLACAWAVMRLLQHRSAALRHQIWTLTMATVMTLPFLAATLPVFRIPFGNSLLAGRFLFRTEVRARQTDEARQPSAAFPPLADSARQMGSVLTLLWTLGATYSLARMAMGWASVERIRRRAALLSAPELASLASQMGVAREIELRQSSPGSMPVTYGLARHTVLLPADALSWDDDRRRAVLLHELAHVRRHDGATQLLARLTLVLYWWHPLVWAAWREFVRERERAADDLVLSVGSSATDYAGHLLAVARAMRSTDSSGWALIAMARPSQLEERVEAILDVRRDRSIPRRATALAAMAMAIVIVAPWSALQAETGTSEFAASTRDESDMIARGKAALSAKDYGSATVFFQKAQAADAHEAAQATMWLAITQEWQENFSGAADLYKDALAKEVADSPSAAIIMDLYARTLGHLKQNEEAARMKLRAHGIRQEQAAERAKSIQPSNSNVYKIGGDVVAPMLLSKIEAHYSDDARLAKFSGTTLLAIEIDAQGLPDHIKVARSLGFGLDQKAMEAVAQWKFKPATLHGLPVSVSANVEVSFKLL